jgi:signal transduction histidine kinase
MLKRLYFRIYLAVLGSLLVFALAVSFVWRSVGESSHRRHSIEMLMQAAQNVLPPAEASQAWQQLALADITRGMQVDLSLYSSDLSLLASVGDALPPPDLEQGKQTAFAQFRPSVIWNMQLPDGRWLRAHPKKLTDRRTPAEGVAFVGALFLLLIVVGVAAYPIARRITRRLEQLQQGVESLGSGDLKARVEVRGKDEVAALATSFNRAASRIEELVGAHRLLLANASHELRTPLTRIRMAIELQKKEIDPTRLRALEQDIHELDAMIESILLSSRLDAAAASPIQEQIDLLALAAEECTRFATSEIDISGEPAMVLGDPQLLRRLIRNLVENALRHGKAPVVVTVRRNGERVELRVTDHGDGVPAAAVETIFEPFVRVGPTDIGGTGLGLSLVRKIARHHGGEAMIETNGPDGFTVKVTI